MENLQPFLMPSASVESNHPRIVELANQIGQGCQEVHQLSKQLFLFVRDSIKYNPYVAFFDLESYRATATLERGNGYCVQKAVLLAALARAMKIPARLIFADIRNHMSPPEFRDLMGTDLFVFHAYVEWYLENQWVRVTPAFNRKICEEHGFPIVEFDGWKDAIFPARASDGRAFVDYVKRHGVFTDVPLPQLLEAWIQTYGKERVELWKHTFLTHPELVRKPHSIKR